MGIEELDHIQNGACKGQWNFIHNNMKRYSCPTCRTMKGFCDPNCKLSHPLEEIQKYLESD